MSPVRFLPVLLFLVLAAFAAEAPRPPNDPPRMLWQPDPVYPDTLVDTWTPGVVQLLVDLGADGRVTKGTVKFATHPDFAQSVLQAIRSWRYAPALRDGQPVATSFLFTQTFSVRQGWQNISNYKFGFELLPGSTKAQQEEFDFPPSLASVVSAVYPYELALAGVRGKAEVVFTVDEGGRVSDMAVVSSTHPELAASLRAMGEACRFEPAHKKWVPKKFQLHRRQLFGPGENYLDFNGQTKKLIKELRAAQPNIVYVAELDTVPQPLYRPAAVYPRGQWEKQEAGSARIEYFIDQEGRAQLPRIISATQPEFGWSAATAVQQRIYEKPVRKGRPVFARAEVNIEFEPSGSR